MVLARARRSLRPPASVTLSLAGDTVQAAGIGAARLGRRRHAPPRSRRERAALDLSGVTAEIPADLATIRETIERERVLFDVGSAALDATARSAVGRVADAFGRLEAGAAALGARATLELAGRTDPTGSDSTNQALSRYRAEAVLGALAARGVPRSAASLRAHRHQPAAPEQRSGGAGADQPERLVPREPGRGSRAGAVAMIQKKVCMVGRLRHRKDQPGAALRALHVLGALSLHRRRQDRPEAARPGRHRSSRSCSGTWRAATVTKTSPPAISRARTPSSTSRTAPGRKPATSFPSCGRWPGRPPGEVPDLLALNKTDLTDQWKLGRGDEEELAGAWDVVRTSAKTGAGVEDVFQRLGRATARHQGGTLMTATAEDVGAGGRAGRHRHREASARRTRITS